MKIFISQNVFTGAARTTDDNPTIKHIYHNFHWCTSAISPTRSPICNFTPAWWKSRSFTGLFIETNFKNPNFSKNSKIFLIFSKSRKTLLFFLSDIAACKDFNQMPASNLAVCFAPSLFQIAMNNPKFKFKSALSRRTGIPKQFNDHTNPISVRISLTKTFDRNESWTERWKRYCWISCSSSMLDFYDKRMQAAVQSSFWIDEWTFTARGLPHQWFRIES